MGSGRTNHSRCGAEADGSCNAPASELSALTESAERAALQSVRRIPCVS